MADTRIGLALALIVAFAATTAMANDADPLQDYCVAMPGTFQFNGLACKAATAVNVTDFVFAGLATAGNTSNAAGSAVTPAFAAQYHALNTLGIALARLDFAKGGIIPFHTHPRGTEVLYLELGSLYTGFVDTSNNLFATTIHAGELFVYPKGLLHFQYNAGDGPAKAISSLTSQNPGAQLLPMALFGTSVEDIVLEKAFGIDQAEVEKIKGNFKSS